MQHGHANRQDGGALYRRIIWLLFAMAAIADGAAGRSWTTRRLILFILRRGERAAYSFVYWASRDCGAPMQWAAPPDIHNFDDPQAARTLARWFRILAASLRDLGRRAMIVTKARHFWGSATLFAAPLRGVISSAAKWPDTS